MSDSSNKKIYKSTDGGKEFSRVDVPFRASFFHFAKDPNLIIGVEENENGKNVRKLSVLGLSIKKISNFEKLKDLD